MPYESVFGIVNHVSKSCPEIEWEFLWKEPRGN